MEGMGKEKPRPRSFTSESRAGTVESSRRGDRSIGRVVRDFDLTGAAVRPWSNRARVDAGHGLAPADGRVWSSRATARTAIFE